MGKVLSLMGFLAILGFGVAGAAQTDRSATGTVSTTLRVKGMACSACAARVEKEAKTIEGVKAVKVSQPKGIAEIAYDPAKTSPQAIAKAISQKTGFKAEPKG